MAGPSKYSLMGRINFEDLYNAFLALEQRNQIFWVSGGVVLLIFLLVFPITCATSKLGQMEKDFEKENKTTVKLLEKVQNYQNSKKQVEELKSELASNSGGSLTTLIESIAKELEIAENINRLKPITLGSTDYYEEEGVDGVLTRVELQPLLQFLHKIETSEATPLRIKKLTIKPEYRNRMELTATFQVSTLKIKEEGASNE